MKNNEKNAIKCKARFREHKYFADDKKQWKIKQQ